MEWRLVVQTAFLKDVGFDEPRIRNFVADLAAFAPTYAWVFAPTSLDEMQERALQNGVPVLAFARHKSGFYCPVNKLLDKATKRKPLLELLRSWGAMTR